MALSVARQPSVTGWYHSTTGATFLQKTLTKKRESSTSLNAPITFFYKNGGPIRNFVPLQLI